MNKVGAASGCNADLQPLLCLLAVGIILSFASSMC